MDYTLSDGVLTIKDGTRTIPPNFFLNNTQIIKVIIPKSVREIGENAFKLCCNLEQFIIPKRGLRIIGDNSFCFNFKIWYRICSSTIT